jgi:PKD domain/Secretion system C-terminal sorting domain
MRSTLHALALGLSTMVSVGAMAQYPYALVLNGTVSSCYPGQTVNVQTAPGTQPSYNIQVPVQPGTCTWSTVLDLSSNPVAFSATTLCNGMVVSYTDSAVFNFIMDSVYLQVNLICDGGLYDCNGVLNGSAMPGSACDDGNAQSMNDIWQANCTCSGTLTYDCLGVLNGPTMPGTVCNDGDSITVNDAWNVYCICTGDSSNYANYDCQGIFMGPNMPGTPCDDGNPVTIGDTWTANCYCAGADTNIYDCLGVINGANMPGTPCNDGDSLTTGDAWSIYCNCVGDSSNYFNYDCLGIYFGPNMPGTPCVTFLGDSGVWNPNCSCIANANAYDCAGVFNGTALPGTSCLWTNDSITFQTGFWSPDCVCALDSNYFFYDCLGVMNGSAWPGTPCVVVDTTLGLWSANCVCEANVPDPCQADFWVLQAYGSDSLPVPYELWIWNLSSGGSGPFSYTWDFGDGTSSTDQFPTHAYANNGPYNLCLTVNDGNGCTSTYCDSVSVDSDGLLNGLLGGVDRTTGFTINVQGQTSIGINEQSTEDGISIWPNPAVEELHIAYISMISSATRVSVYDLEGRVVTSERLVLVAGRNQLSLSTVGLDAGIYLLRVGQGATTVERRFVKVN